jgi:hypothetical protein
LAARTREAEAMKFSIRLAKATLGSLLFLACIVGSTGSTAATGHVLPKHPQYVPGLGEFMGGIQLRHAKLWFAGQAQNWPLASYELDEILEAFDDIAIYQPQIDNKPAKQLIDTTVGKPLERLKSSISSKDAAGFVTAFDSLSQACSACHASAHHDFIVIQRPESIPLTNQRFSP